MLGKNKIDILQEQLVQTYEKYLDARKKYEEEMRRTYVLQQALEETKKENEDLKREERSLRVREVQDQNIQTDQIAEEPHPVTHMDVDEFEISHDAKIRTMKQFLIHRITALKRVSVNVHSMYITLQSNEYQCSEALSLLSPLFAQWGPYIQFFDRLVPLLT